ncbi:MAG: diaminopimelate decarboxylase [Lachnospiraceae bacterium]|nr:diaminopimelate decarboxylase [Lachnospiraceae bacterium]
MNENFICENINVNEEGHLTFAGLDTSDLAATFQTPVYLMDEERIRVNCRAYTEAFKEHFGGESRPLYASKANSFKYIYKIMKEEGMGIDVVSGGEILCAYKAGYDLSKAFFHSNNKTDADIAFAMDLGIGHFVVDGFEELYAIEEEAARRDMVQDILLRITPGIDPHTYVQVNTGTVDSKFGTAIETGQADEIIEAALGLPHIHLNGFHCHVGSQVFAEDVFERAAVVMVKYIAHINRKYGYLAPILNMGGGFGVRYVDTDPYLDVSKKIADLAEAIHATCEREGIPVPTIIMEPGRSIVADAGMTLYTVGSVKRIPYYKNYVSVDGGMSDNPRYALYGSKYTCYTANRMNEERDMNCNVVGRCCESGDIIQRDVQLPSDTQRGDIVAVCTTGAYNYSMASNYNKIPMPPIVMITDGQAKEVVRRQTFEDLISLDVD